MPDLVRHTVGRSGALGMDDGEGLVGIGEHARCQAAGARVVDDQHRNIGAILAGQIRPESIVKETRSVCSSACCRDPLAVAADWPKGLQGLLSLRSIAGR